MAVPKLLILGRWSELVTWQHLRQSWKLFDWICTSTPYQLVLSLRRHHMEKVVTSAQKHLRQWNIHIPTVSQSHTTLRYRIAAT